MCLDTVGQEFDRGHSRDRWYLGPQLGRLEQLAVTWGWGLESSGTSLLMYQTPNLEWLESSLGWDCQLEPHLMQVSSGCPNQRHFQKPGVPRSQVEATWPLMTYLWKSHCITSNIVYKSKSHHKSTEIQEEVRLRIFYFLLWGTAEKYVR